MNDCYQNVLQVSIYVCFQTKIIIQINYQKEWRRNDQLVQYLNLNCNICENRKNFKIDVEDLSLLKYKLLKIRTKIKCFNTVKNVCKYHKTRFVTVFSNYYGRCADPLRSLKNFVKTSLHEICLEEFRLYCVPYDILPWQKLC